MLMQCYLEGRQAFRNRLNTSDCPYTLISDDRRIPWLHGWGDESVGAPLATCY